MDNDVKKAKSEAKVAHQIAKYSTDYDMTLVIKFVFGSLALCMVGLFVLEVVGQTIFKIQGKTASGAIYLTPELIHSLVGYISGYASAIVTFLFGKKLAEKLTLRNGNEPKQEEK